MKLRLPSALLLLLPVMFLVSCGQAGEAPATGDESQLIGHVHGLGVDPADGALYVAGHNGVFRVEDGIPTRIADRWQDTMAFTVAGPGTFLASGHPDLREDLPPHLGLVESTDAGKSWTALSLVGEADFHALEVAGETLYGYDSRSGRLMSTTDRRSWKTIATGQYVDLAALPERPDRVLATTRTGGVHEVSLKGGMRPVVDAPPLLLIDSSPAGVFVGVTGSGDVFTSRSGRGLWKRAGQVPGSPAALTATDANWFLATDDTIYESHDGGTSWTPIVG